MKELDIKIKITYTPDVKINHLQFKDEITIREAFEKMKEFIDTDDVYADYLFETLSGEFLFDIYLFEPYYSINKKYKHLEPLVADFCNKYIKKQ